MIKIIVFLIIIAVLAVATITSLPRFVKNTKQKSLTNRVMAVYDAIKIYANNQYVHGESDENIANAITGVIGPLHVLHSLLQNNTTGKISSISVKNGTIKSFSYIDNNIQARYKAGVGITFVEDASRPGTVEVSSRHLTSPDIVKNTTFDTGRTVNIKIKKLAGSTNDADLYTENNNIQGILRAHALPENIDTNDDNHILSAVGIEHPKIFAWYQNNKIYYYTEADNIFLNSDSGELFSGCRSLSDISELQNWDTSNVTDLSSIFANCSSLTNLTPLQNWNTSNVMNLANAFSNCTSLTNLTGLQNWDTSNLAVLPATFSGCSSLTSLAGLQDWDASNMMNLSSTFSQCSSLENITALQNWDTSNVINLNLVFNGCTRLSNARCLNDWSTSKVEYKTDTFNNTTVAINGNIPSWY